MKGYLHQPELTGQVVCDGWYITGDLARIDADGFIVANRSGPAGPSGPEPPAEPLTPREIEVLELLAEGLTNKGIAARLGISDQTVKFHVASILGKLGASSRTEAVRRAVRRGLLAL